MKHPSHSGKRDPPKRVLERHEIVGNFYARVQRVVADFGDGKPREAYEPFLPDGVHILPLTDEGKVVLVHQYRLFGKGWAYELPAGAMDKEELESPEECALRELEEETGYVAHELQPLLTYEAHSTMRTQSHLFVARKLEKKEPKREPTEQEMSVIEVTPTQFWEMCLDGTITQGQSLLACFLAKEKGILKIDKKSPKPHPF